MRRPFDVCRYSGASTADDAPYVCVLQSHYLADMVTVIVAPLLRAAVAATDSQVAVAVLIGAVVASLIDHEYDIRRALDRLFTRF